MLAVLANRRQRTLQTLNLFEEISGRCFGKRYRFRLRRDLTERRRRHGRNDDALVRSPRTRHGIQPRRTEGRRRHDLAFRCGWLRSSILGLFVGCVCRFCLALVFVSLQRLCGLVILASAKRIQRRPGTRRQGHLHTTIQLSSFARRLFRGITAEIPEGPAAGDTK